MKRRSFLAALLALPFVAKALEADPRAEPRDFSRSYSNLAQRKTEAALFALSLQVTKAEAIADAKRGGWGKGKHTT